VFVLCQAEDGIRDFHVTGVQTCALPISESTSPKARASPGETRPDGTGRLAVRLITASMSASYHMLSEPEAPAPTAIARMAMRASRGLMSAGAASRPTKAVNTTSDITRGFRRAK